MTMGLEQWVRGILIGTVVTGFCSQARPADAAHINLAPSLSLEERWDSNIFNTSSNEESDTIFRAKPELALLIETSQTIAKLSGGVELERYTQHDELNDATATIDLGLSLDKPIQLSPRFSFLPSAKYVETQDTSRRNLLLPEPSPGIPASETIVTERRKARDYSASLRLMYLLSQRVDVSLGGSISRRDFVGQSTPFTEEDSKTVSGDTTLSYRITPRFSSGIFMNTSQNRFERSPSSSTYAGGLLSTYLLTHQSTLEVRAGATYLKEDASATSPENKEWSPYGSLSLRYTKQSFQTSLSGAYELAGGGSFGRTTRRATIGLTLKDQFSRRWGWDLSGYFQGNRSNDEPRTEDINSTGGTVQIRYEAMKWASIRLGGEILRQQSKGLEGSDVDRESVFLLVDLGSQYRLY